MRYADFLDTRLRHTVHVLGLGGLALAVLQLLARLDLDTEFASSLQERDPHNRSGVLSWSALVSDFLQNQGDVEGLERAVKALSGWGLLQVVGQGPRDPVVPGPAPLRLTYAGRSCIGLAPGRALPMDGDGQVAGWTVLHSVSRERLFLHVRQLDRDVAQSTVVIGSDDTAERVAGRIAMQLVQHSACAVDAYQTDKHELVDAVLSATAVARRPRYLLVPDPSRVRIAALRVGATLTWIEPHVDTRRDANVMDFDLSKMLGAEERNDGRVIGVPDSSLASPRRVDTRWEQLVVPDRVAWELKQVLVHARYRLESDEDQGPTRGKGYRLLLSGLPGTGKSMCAEALANTLDRPLVKLDLSSVLSKWLGETEKLLGQVFDVAEASRAVLVLDEAEALLRQRDSGKGGGMGALSTGVAYLLTRLDRYTGVLVATTNRTKDLDEAFFRRFDDFVVLPVPDQRARQVLWTMALGDAMNEHLDLGLLSENFAITGGLIKSAAIRAKAWAFGLERTLDMPLILASLARELDKSDRSAAGVLVEPYRDQVKAILEGRL